MRFTYIEMLTNERKKLNSNESHLCATQSQVFCCFRWIKKRVVQKSTYPLEIVRFRWFKLHQKSLSTGHVNGKTKKITTACESENKIVKDALISARLFVFARDKWTKEKKESTVSLSIICVLLMLYLTWIYHENRQTNTDIVYKNIGLKHVECWSSARCC